MLINCPSCDARVSDQAQACPSCGHPLREPAAVKSAVSPNIAAVLSVIPGLGHLYLGQPFQGLLWFLMTAGAYLLWLPGVVMHVLCVVMVLREARRL